MQLLSDLEIKYGDEVNKVQTLRETQKIFELQLLWLNKNVLFYSKVA